MKKIWIVALMVTGLMACQEQAKNVEETETKEQTVEVAIPDAFFGEKIEAAGAIDVSELASNLGKHDSIQIKLSGTVDKVCQVKGCWMTMKYNEDGESMRVTFKDYGFFVPKNIDGKEVIIDGHAKVETTTVDELRHYAEDEGLTEEEINAITEDETELTFVANGVIVKSYDVEVGSAEADELNHEHLEEDH